MDRYKYHTSDTFPNYFLSQYSKHTNSIDVVYDIKRVIKLPDEYMSINDLVTYLYKLL